MVVRDGRGRFANRPPYRVRGRLYVVVVGFGGWVDFGRRLGAFAVASVEEDSGCCEPVVLGGVVRSLCDVVEEV